MAIRCACPGKVMLAGEYAVMHGGPAVMVAVNAEARARLAPKEQELSAFLREVRRCVAEHFGDASEEAAAAKKVVVDTSAFHEGDAKLGLGSSAAATVVAVGCALASTESVLDFTLVHKLAAKAHRRAQSLMGTPGSGADVATCIYGGALRFERRRDDEEPVLQALELPDDLHLVFPWTGVVAATAPLVAQVQAYRSVQPEPFQHLIDDISLSANALASATGAAEAIRAIDAGARALQNLARASQVPLWLPVHSELATLAQELGGALKPTGAGAGDLAVAAFADPSDAQHFRKGLQELGILCPNLDVQWQGVRLQD